MICNIQNINVTGLILLKYYQKKSNKNVYNQDSVPCNINFIPFRHFFKYVRWKSEKNRL